MSTTASEPKALLLVFTEVGDNLTEAEYHDWYDNEHIPLRLAIPQIRTATRFVAADGAKPLYTATYDLDSLDVLNGTAYKALFSDRSARETDVLKRLEFLDRRLYTLNEQAPRTVKPGFNEYKEGVTTVFVGIDIAEGHEEEFNRWYDEEHTPMLMKVPGWLRSRRFTLQEAGATGELKGAGPYKAPPKFLSVHDYEGPDGLTSEEFKAAVSTPWRDEIWKHVLGRERRVFKLYKEFKSPFAAETETPFPDKQDVSEQD